MRSIGVLKRRVKRIRLEEFNDAVQVGFHNLSY